MSKFLQRKKVEKNWKSFPERVDSSLMLCYYLDNKERDKQSSKGDKIMKKTISILIVITIITFLFFNTKNYYSKDCIVTEVEGSTITVVDQNGYSWEFTGDNYKINDNITVIMNTMNTDSIFDDAIVSIK